MSKPKYYISNNNEFVIENYNSAPTFSSFFPGIAGVFGSPLWVFYANRGQGITSCGIKDKDHAIIEFQPANKAYTSVSLQGFRTFIKVDGHFYEPFAECSSCKNQLKITSSDMTIIEENQELKLRIKVNYFTVPNEEFPALARVLTITNFSKKPRKIEVVDGLPAVIPYGFNDDLLKKISTTISAWCLVENFDQKAPFYKLKVLPADVSETKLIEKGNFYLAFAQESGQELPIDLIIDPKIVFGENKSLGSPDAFINNGASRNFSDQRTCGIMPAAFSHSKADLKKEVEIFTLLGQADSIKLLNRIKKRVLKRDFFDKKARENKVIMEELGSNLKIKSSSKGFDQYCQQSFIDNVLRGGFPLKLGDKVVYTYYRKHGDMERDYNDFSLMPTYFSQGNGNYRDINQNRRCDIFINPDSGEDNIVRFFNLIQLDGFNPLVVLGIRYRVASEKQAAILIDRHLKETSADLAGEICRPFVLGAILQKIDQDGTLYKTSREDFARELVNSSETEEGALHGEGFWIDHFFYNTDLLESFKCLYPEKMNDLLFNKKVFTFFDNDHIVLDRQSKYFLRENKVRQFESVKPDPEKAALISSRKEKINVVRDDHGKGRPYQTNLMAKILNIVANKAASFDAQGIGLEMEAEKPDWYDALNGLPALLGSSLSETFELKRLASFALKHLDQAALIELAAETADYIENIDRLLAANASSFEYWDRACGIKESYRQATRLGLSGKEKKVPAAKMIGFFKNVIDKCDQGIKKCLKKHKNYYTYFINEVSDHEDKNGRIKVKGFSQKALPLFLEGFVHALKVEKDQSIYRRVKNSPLYDKKLKMYKVNSPLDKAPVEIGRCKIFNPGWLENESIWLHMEYKYMLELLKAGLYKEFFADLKNVLIPFMDPKVYKRSVLENSSFIVSSVNPNKENHGRGFVARLSGATAEFIDMWLHMTTGKNIFYLDAKKELCFKLQPILPAWLFDKGRLSFKLLGKIDVLYLNPKKKDVFAKLPLSYKLTLDNNKEVEIKTPFVPEPYASLIRERKVTKMVVKLT